LDVEVTRLGSSFGLLRFSFLTDAPDFVLARGMEFLASLFDSRIFAGLVPVQMLILMMHVVFGGLRSLLLHPSLGSERVKL